MKTALGRLSGKSAAMSAQAALSAAPGVLRQRRYRCWCPSCAGRAEQPVSADHWHINASLGRALSQAKRAGFLWRQRAREQQRSLFWLKQGAVQKARAVQKALDILLELDVRLVCEASGQGFFTRGQPRLLQQMLSEPGLVLARPGWLREYLCGIWIGAGAYADARGEHTMSVSAPRWGSRPRPRKGRSAVHQPSPTLTLAGQVPVNESLRCSVRFARRRPCGPHPVGGANQLTRERSVIRNGHRPQNR